MESGASKPAEFALTSLFNEALAASYYAREKQRVADEAAKEAATTHQRTLEAWRNLYQALLGFFDGVFLEYPELRSTPIGSFLQNVENSAPPKVNNVYNDR